MREHICSGSYVMTVPGSSPRMRGTPFRHGLFAVPVGIIPAYAGNTASTIILRQGRGDHPRVCGEHAPADKAEAAVAGSSPRMRGTRPCLQWNLRNVGIIPAYAGNTRSPRSPTRCGWDHPRVCGEHLDRSAPSPISSGSSPRMRGTPDRRCRPVPRAGIIPAYVGNTGGGRDSRHRGRDHPRVCGEHWSVVVEQVGRRGSSPRMRGTPFHCSLIHGWTGIIPAYAGNTSVSQDRQARSRDHPRVCGEHGHVQHSRPFLQGSSPRMRGTPKRAPPRRCLSRIIPAYAGNTCSRDWSAGSSRDHPRVCGEH